MKNARLLKALRFFMVVPSAGMLSRAKSFFLVSPCLS
ncbi:hypothetical protein ECKG_05006 [Escherichia coli TA206]|nr:hypothetical protein ECKG_05006 [Escherichia coli TA206]OSL81100.1 hypothetical protein EAZG_05147 [Escherichia coli TA249]